jgi:hypothetical protein
LDDLTKAIEEQKLEELRMDCDDNPQDSVKNEQQKMDDKVADARAMIEHIDLDADTSRVDFMEIESKVNDRLVTSDMPTGSAVPPTALTRGKPSSLAAQVSEVSIQIISCSLDNSDS